MTQNSKTALNKSRQTDLIQSVSDQISNQNTTENKISSSDELEKREKELNMRELKFKAKQLLSQKSLPTELADILKLDDEKTVEQAIEKLAKLIGKNEKDTKLKVLDEKKLPDSKSDEKNMGKLRKAFGLI